MLLYVFGAVTSVCSAQNLSVIRGKVIDASTNAPIRFVTVYFANSSIGTASQADGSFKLEKIPVGKYDLVASMIGYGRFSKSIEFKGDSITSFFIQLSPVAVELESVTISAHREKPTTTAYRKFERLFLGQTSNAFNCKILNGKDIHAFEKDQKVTAYANKPIVVLNNALGYKVFYDLREFQVDFALNRLVILGQVRFEELTPINEKQKNKWIKERDRAYYGSHVHFLLSLLTGKISDNFYTIRGTDGTLIKENDLIKNGIIQFNGLINVDYSKENSTQTPGGTFGQQSQVVFNGQPIRVYENGYFEDFHNIVFLGHFQLSNVADQVPLGFSPSSPLK